jgi:hypothetical protein
MVQPTHNIRIRRYRRRFVDLTVDIPTGDRICETGQDSRQDGPGYGVSLEHLDTRGDRLISARIPTTWMGLGKDVTPAMCLTREGR